MNPLVTLLGYLVSNPFTSSAGLGLLLTNLGPVLTALGSGAPLNSIIGDPHFNAVLTGLVGLAAKDMNVTGGRKQQ